MYPNLNAEQARFGHSNQKVAEYLGISRRSFENKKEKATFKVTECQKLCLLYECKFEYLFDNFKNK